MLCLGAEAAAPIICSFALLLKNGVLSMACEWSGSVAALHPTCLTDSINFYITLPFLFALFVSWATSTQLLWAAQRGLWGSKSSSAAPVVWGSLIESQNRYSWKGPLKAIRSNSPVVSRDTHGSSGIRSECGGLCMHTRCRGHRCGVGCNKWLRRAEQENIEMCAELSIKTNISIYC